MFYVYAINEKDTGNVFYIGFTKRPLHKRLQQHRWDSNTKKNGHWKYNHHMARKIRKFQKENRKVEIQLLVSCTDRSTILQKEIEYISWCRKMNFRLCNCTDGGDGGRGRQLSKAEKKHLSKINSGKGNPQWGKSPSKETRAKQRKALKGKPRPKPKDYEGWKRRISQNHTDVSGENNPMYGKPAPTRKKTIQYDMQGNKIAEFSSATAAARAVGLSRVTVSNCASGNSSSAGGFRWAYDAS